MGQLNSGQLQERVTLLTTAAPVADAGGYGSVASGPDTKQAVWARVRPLRADEKLRLGQIINAEAYEITIRRLPGTSAKQRVEWKDKTLNIIGVSDDENRECQRLTCLNGGQ